MATRASEVFVGRARELAELEDALAAARAGTGAAVLVAGDAGIGKTRIVSELGRRALGAGFEVLLGRAIDFVGTELPYQPMVEALRPLGASRQIDGQQPASQRQVFEKTLALLIDRAAEAPVLLVLEDLHWADISTLDLVAFLAHNLDQQPVLLLATYRADEHASAERMRRLAGGVRRSGAGLLIELGPLPPGELTTLLTARADVQPSTALIDAIVSRAEGNPFYAEELLAAGGRSDELPGGLRAVLLQRVAQLDRATQGLLRLAAAAGRNVSYSLLRAAAALPERDVRESLRTAVEHGVLVPEQSTDGFRFRHALLAEAVYSTILPGEREELHARLAHELARSGAARAAELAPHWAAAGRAAEALTASVDAAREAETVFGLAEAHGHLERALALWPAVPDAAARTGIDLAELCTRTAEIAAEIGAAARAVELGRRAIQLAGSANPHRCAILHVRLGEYLHASGSYDALLAELERAVEIVPAQPPSPERAYALGSLAGALMVARRHAESLPIAEQALELARRVGAREAEVRALTVLGGDLAYLGRAEEGLTHFDQARHLAEQIGDRIGLDRAYVNVTDALTMLGRNRESARVAHRGLEVMRRHGVESSLLVANRIEALLALGDWAEADTLSATALRGTVSSFSSSLLVTRAAVEIGCGNFAAAREHLDAASAGQHVEREFGLPYHECRAELALWERRWTDADSDIRAGLARSRGRATAQIRVMLCAVGLRAQAELAALARARQDQDAVGGWLARAEKLIREARRAGAQAAAVTPNAGGWLRLAEAEYQRAHRRPGSELWSAAAACWERLDRPPLVAYCRWRQAEALVAVGASRTEASVPLRDAHAIAGRIGAKPLVRELELLAQRARLDLASPQAASAAVGQGLAETLGLTTREAQVLTLVARGYTNREIAAALVISVKTAGVHVSHILRKLGAANRLEAAQIAHHLAAPSVTRPQRPARDLLRAADPGTTCSNA